MLRSSALLLVIFAAVGCGRWMEYAPTRLQGSVHRPDVVYHRLVRRAAAMGYHLQTDPARCSFRVLAKLDQHRRYRPRKASWFHVTVQPNGAVDVVAYGAHVRDGNTVIHRKLCRELTSFMDGLTVALGRPPRAVAFAN